MHREEAARLNGSVAKEQARRIPRSPQKKRVPVLERRIEIALRICREVSGIRELRRTLNDMKLSVADRMWFQSKLGIRDQ
jgi:hypothetical protein